MVQQAVDKKSEQEKLKKEAAEAHERAEKAEKLAREAIAEKEAFMKKIE
jgi:hypothetical protein